MLEPPARIHVIPVGMVTSDLEKNPINPDVSRPIALPKPIIDTKYMAILSFIPESVARSVKFVH